MASVAITPEDAFEVLEEFIQERLAALQESGVVAMRSGDFERAREVLAGAEQLKDMLARVNQLEEEFNTFVAAPEGQAEEARLRKGLKTPQEAYYVPLLEVLVEMGGSGPVRDVLGLIHQRMQPLLNEHDLAMLPSGRDPRWRTTAMWARFQLVQQGLLRDDSPFGTWEISDEGRRWLEERG